MFAILVSEENREKIMSDIASKTPDHAVDYGLFSNRESGMEYYYITGYVEDSGTVLPWALIPRFVLFQEFEFDREKITTDFDQIVRK